MKIKKTFQGELPENRIVNAKSNSQTDAYSANYLNDKLNKVVVSLEEPITGEEVWVKRSINMLKFSDFTKEVNGITFKMEDQVLSIKGTATAYTQECYMPIKKILEEDMTLTQYTSGKADGLVTKAAYTDNGTSYYPNLLSVELNKGAYIDQLYFIISEGAVIDAEVRFQLESGKGVHDWQPVTEKQVFVKNENGVYEELVKKNLHVGIDEPKNGEDVWVKKSKNRANISTYGATIYKGLDIADYLQIGETYSVSFKGDGTNYLFLTKVGAYDAMTDDMLEIATPGNFSFVYTREMHDKGYELYILHEDGVQPLTQSEMFNFNLQIEQGTSFTVYEKFVGDKMYIKDVNGNYAEYKKAQVNVGISTPKTGEDVWVQKSKNLFDISLFNYAAVKTVSILLDYYSVPIYLGKPNTVYSVSTTFLNGYTPVGKAIYILVCPTAENNNGWVPVAHAGQPPVDGGYYNYQVTSDANGYAYFRVSKGTNQERYEEFLANSLVQIEQGAASTSYEPYMTKKVYVKNENGAYDIFYDESASEVYSWDERRIGTHLGKPLYRRVIEYTVTTTNSARYTIPNLDKIVDIRGMARGSGNQLKINHYLGGDADNFVSAWVSNGNVYSICSSAYSGYVAELVLDYTKITD